LAHDQGIARGITIAGFLLLIASTGWGLLSAGRSAEMERLALAE
jgi:hypothetical protein